MNHVESYYKDTKVVDDDVDFSNKLLIKQNVNARNRWKLLARAVLTENRREVQTMKEEEKESSIIEIRSPTFNESCQHFDGFDLVKISQSVNLASELFDANNCFTIAFDNVSNFNCNVHLKKLWNTKDLMGFNNSGSFFWSSEAAMCYFILDNLHMFNDAWVLELGGGMFCLGALMIAKYGKSFCVHMSDGNEKSLENVKKSVKLNDVSCFVKCSVLRWEKATKEFCNEKGKYDFVLCADCLFFDDSRAALVESINHFLADDGQALVFAPRRKTTMNSFINKCINKGMNCEIFTYYNAKVWESHLRFKDLSSKTYDEDKHYPILIKLTRLKQSS